MSLSRQQWFQAQAMLDELFQHATQQQKITYMVMYASVRQEMVEQAVNGVDGASFTVRVKRVRKLKEAEPEGVDMATLDQPPTDAEVRTTGPVGATTDGTDDKCGGVSPDTVPPATVHGKRGKK